MRAQPSTDIIPSQRSVNNRSWIACETGDRGNEGRGLRQGLSTGSRLAGCYLISREAQQTSVGVESTGLVTTTG